MKKIKDNFSKQSSFYNQFRPTFPEELFHFILRFCTNKMNCWDCGTGNGQVAKELSNHYENVYATDISQNQLNYAIKKPNIYYSECRAEKTSFPNNYFDLITVGQAIHWFDFEKFYQEARRVSQPDAVIAVFGYGLIKLEDDIEENILDFYKNKVGRFWDKERIFIDEEYTTIPFPFKEIKVHQKFNISRNWSVEDLEGYLNTWSSVQKYISKKNKNPVNELIDIIKKKYVNVDRFKVTFPVFIRIGKII